jgi:hypothetical protein
MTVSELRERMSAEEFNGWAMYYARQAQLAELSRLKARG